MLSLLKAGIELRVIVIVEIDGGARKGRRRWRARRPALCALLARGSALRGRRAVVFVIIVVIVAVVVVVAVVVDDV